MVVPGGHHRCRSTQLLESRLRLESRISLFEHFWGSGVTVDVVAKKNEKLWFGGEHGVPDRLRLVLFGAGTKSDTGQFVRRIKASRRSEPFP